MNNQPEDNQPTVFGRPFAYAVSASVFFALFVCAVVVRYHVVSAGLGFLLVMLACGCAVSAWMVVNDESRIRRDQQELSRREHRRHLARRRLKANLESQLRKPDFKTRLRQFTNSSDENGAEDAESQMEFWERDKEYSLTPTRPIELIRYLLQRISKLVDQG